MPSLVIFLCWSKRLRSASDISLYFFACSLLILRHFFHKSCIIFLVDKFLFGPLEHYAVLLREEKKRTKRSFGRNFPHLQRHTIIAHVFSDVLLSFTLVHWLKLMLQHAWQCKACTVNLCILSWMCSCTNLFWLSSILFYLLCVCLRGRNFFFLLRSTLKEWNVK